MAKKVIIIEILVLILISLLLGSTSGGSLISGDINMIDEGQFVAWGSHMLNGKKMYEDIYITYGPLYVYPVYLIFKYFSVSAFYLRIYLLFGSLISAVVTVLIMHKLKINILIRWTTQIVLILLPILLLRHAFGLLAIFLLMILLEQPNKYLYLLLGMVLGISLLISPDITLAAGIVSAGFILLKVRKNKHEIMLASFLPIGIVAVIAPFIYWSTTEGWFMHYIINTLDTMKSLSGDETPLGQGFPNLIAMIRNIGSVKDLLKFPFNKELLLYWGILFYVIFYFYILQKLIIRKLTLEDKKILILGVFGFILYFILIGRSGIGHFFFILSPLLIVHAFFAQSLVNFLKKKNNQTEKITAYLLLSLYFFFCLRLLSIYRPQIEKNIKYISKIGEVRTNPSIIGPIAISKEQSEYIKQMQNFSTKYIPKNSPVFFLSDEPFMYLVVNRINPTRYDLPFIASSKPNRYELLSSLIKNPPMYIIENKNTWSVDGISNRERLPEVSELIKSHYILTKKSNYIFIYKLKGDSI